MSAAAALAGSGLSARAMAEAAKSASRVLAALDEAKRNAALEAMARRSRRRVRSCWQANAEDVRAEGGTLKCRLRLRG